MTDWTFAQKAIVVLAALQLLWALAGFIADRTSTSAPTRRPRRSSASTSTATTPWPACSSSPPAFYFARRPDWAFYYAIYAAGALFITGIWALFDEQPAWVFTFPDNFSDAIFHLATGHFLPASSRSS
jgi:hypothetical protein